jgi:hypothetical protein
MAGGYAHGRWICPYHVIMHTLSTSTSACPDSSTTGVRPGGSGGGVSAAAQEGAVLGRNLEGPALRSTLAHTRGAGVLHRPDAGGAAAPRRRRRQWQQLRLAAAADQGGGQAAVPSPRHKYPDRNPDLTEISLRFGEPVCLMMTWSRYLHTYALGQLAKLYFTDARVSHFLAWIGSPCLRHCVHGAPIGGGARLPAPALRRARARLSLPPPHHRRCVQG